MTPELNAVSRVPRYPVRTRVFAALVLPLGWATVASLRLGTSGLDFLYEHLPSPLFYLTTIVVELGAVLLFVACGFLAFRSIPGETSRRESHGLCTLVPALLLAAFLVAIAAPLSEQVAAALGVLDQECLGAWTGFQSLVVAFVLGITFVAPLQFLGRGVSATARRTGILVLVVIPLALALPVQTGEPSLASALAGALALTLAAIAVGGAQACRRSLELGEGLAPGLLSSDEPRPSRAYETEEGMCRVAVALSGGGYRASLFALGALMYVHDACRDSSRRRKVVAVSSVSGGSITNAVLAHGVKLGKSTDAELDRVGRLLVRHTVRTGSMWRTGALYYLGLFLGLGVGLPLLGAFAVSHLTWLLLFHCLVIVAVPAAFLVLGPPLASAIPSPRQGLLAGLRALILFLAFTVGPGVLLHLALSDPAWRLAVAWVGTTLLVAAGVSLAYWLRGPLIQKNYESLLRSVSVTPQLADIPEDTHHVFCATEVQFDETVYLAPDALRSRSFRETRPGQFPTALAVRASAAFPGGFPPVVLGGFKGRGSVGTPERGDRKDVSAGRVVLVDGGVRDNLGTSWFEAHGLDWDELVVVSAAANRHTYRTISRLPGLAEALSLRNLLNIPYNTRERHRRRTLAAQLLARPWRDGQEAAAGAVVHIEDSPFDLARKILDTADWKEQAGAWLEVAGLPDWEVDQVLAATQLRDAAGDKAAVLRQRAEAVMRHLSALEQHLPAPPPIPQNEYVNLMAGLVIQSQRFSKLPPGDNDQQMAWWKRVERTAQIGTTLGRIRPEDAVNLLLHGYYLTMANLHLGAGWPLTNTLNRARLEEIFGEVPTWPLSDEQAARKDAHREMVRLLSRPLQPNYPIVCLYSVSLTVRQGGRLPRKDAVVGLAVNRAGRLEVLGAWMGPHYAELPHESPFQVWEGLKARRNAFWRGVVNNLHVRGCRTIAMGSRSISVDLPLGRRELFEGLDPVFRDVYPRTLLWPRLGDLVYDSTAHHRLTGPPAGMAEELTAVVRAPGAAQAREALDRFAEKWGANDNKGYAQIRHAWLKVWGPISAVFGVPEVIRDFLEALDTFLDEARKSFEDSCKKQGAFSDDEVALARLHADLQERIKKWKRGAGWPKILQRFDEDLTPSSEADRP